MQESQPSGKEDLELSPEYTSFDFIKLMLSQIDRRDIDEVVELLLHLMEDPGMIDSKESEILEQLIFDYRGKQSDPMFIDVFKTAVNNFFREAQKRNLLHRKMGMEGFGSLTLN